jgi:hypothetical protein
MNKIPVIEAGPNPKDVKDNIIKASQQKDADRLKEKQKIPEYTHIGFADNYNLLCRDIKELPNGEKLVYDTEFMRVKGNAGLILRITTMQIEDDALVKLSSSVCFIPGAAVNELNGNKFIQI